MRLFLILNFFFGIDVIATTFNSNLRFERAEDMISSITADPLEEGPDPLFLLKPAKHSIVGNELYIHVLAPDYLPRLVVNGKKSEYNPDVNPALYWHLPSGLRMPLEKINPNVKPRYGKIVIQATAGCTPYLSLYQNDDFVQTRWSGAKQVEVSGIYTRYTPDKTVQHWEISYTIFPDIITLVILTLPTNPSLPVLGDCQYFLESMVRKQWE